MAERLIVDREQIETYARTIFAYASPNTVISIRVFEENSDTPVSILPVRLNGNGLDALSEAAVQQAQFAADHRKQTVFCPPLCSFTNEGKAREEDVAEGYLLTVECDQAPEAARQRLENLLGRATLVIASGGLWRDPATGEAQPKLHLHWRLSEPATDNDLALLKRARRLATAFVGGDPSAVPVNHPMRWAGSWHRKGEPRLARIVAQSGNEIDLREALELLAHVEPAPVTARPGGRADAGPPKGAGEAGDPRSDAVLIANITSGAEFHPSVVPLAARLLGRGMHAGAVVTFIRGLMEEIPQSQRDERWQSRWAEVPKIVASAEAKWPVSAEPEPDRPSVTEPVPHVRGFDWVWNPFDAPPPAPAFPFDALPDYLQRWTLDRASATGGDRSGFAMAELVALSGSIDHRIKLVLKPDPDEPFEVHARLWGCLCGPPSFMKTPMIKAPTTVQCALDAAAMASFAEARAIWKATKGDDKGPEPEQPYIRVIDNLTVERLATLCAAFPRGQLITTPELLNFIGQFDRYAKGAAGADQAFWNRVYDGGPFLMARQGSGDQAGRSDRYIPNLSASILGAVQPDKLASLGKLTDDGFLQRFLPTMLRAPSEENDDHTSSQYDAERRRQIVQSLASLTVEALRDRSRFTLSTEALEVRKRIRAARKVLETATEPSAAFGGACGKIENAFGALVLILHLLDCIRLPVPVFDMPREVSGETAERAATIVEMFLIPHLARFYEQLAGASTVNYRPIAAAILAHDKPRILLSDFQRGPRAIRDAARAFNQNPDLRDFDRLLRPFEIGNWLTPVHPSPWRRAWLVTQGLAARFAAEQAAYQAAARAITEKIAASATKP